MRTKIEIENFAHNQKCGLFHPFTCDRHSENCEKKKFSNDYSKDGILELSEDNHLICPCGDYKQEYQMICCLCKKQVMGFYLGNGQTECPHCHGIPPKMSAEEYKKALE